ncbi:MAG: 4a-hydroxytetrahydrobiopterin dehydratase [bacterium]|nr:4a-hydroxytetrahydrobiopterin dehydratase [bacterium]
MSLRAKHCVSCEGGVPKLDADDVARLAGEIPDWVVRDAKLHRTFAFRDFATAMRFVNRMADLAEAEGHHPDFTVHYREVQVTIWTHTIGGLSENDFILAARIDALETA